MRKGRAFGMVEKKGLSGSALKILAVISMMIDHIGYALVAPVLRIIGTEGKLYFIYRVMRSVGRLAFPIYCFLLVEGFQRTHDKKKYAFRLLTFAFISEVPFDLAFYRMPFYISRSNVFFTLFLAFMMMLLMEESEKRFNNIWLSTGACIISFVAAALCAELIHCDYGAKGIIAVVLLYLFRKNKKEQLLAGCVAFLWEVTASLAFIPIAFYNGKRGIKLKYIFYAFYPVHLIFLHLIYYLFIKNSFFG